MDISKPLEKPSPTNASLKRLFDAAGKCTYVGYTATSAAVKLAHVDSWISPDFQVLLPPGKGYVGNRDLFGESKQILDEQSQKNSGPHQIKKLKDMTVTLPNGEEGD